MRGVFLVAFLCLSVSCWAQDKEAMAKDHFSKAINHSIKGEIKDAVLDYEKAIEYDPSYEEALYNLGALYYNQGLELSRSVATEVETSAELKKGMESNYRKAAEYFERVVALNPSDAQTLGSLKQIYVVLEEYEKAGIVKKKLDALMANEKKE